MKEVLQSALSKTGYQDLRYEQVRSTTIVYQGSDLTEISVSAREGGHARVFYEGGWGHFSFTGLDGRHAAIETALANARLVSENRKTRYDLAKAPVVEDVVRINPPINPGTITLEEKRRLLARYSELAMQVEGIKTTIATYHEDAAHKFFANNEGSYIEQEELLCGIRLRLIAGRGRDTQRISVALGGSQDFGLLQHAEEEVLAAARLAVSLLDAEQVTSGNYTVILDPEAAGVFVHEAFGHLSEADGLAENRQLRETMDLGRVFGKPVLNIVDDGSVMGHPGSIVYDDEGVAAVKTYLIKDGILRGRLHSRETAGQLGEPLTGNSRAQDFRYHPIVRMSNIYIEEGQTSFAEMIGSIKDGLYLIGAAGGQTSGDSFTLGTQYGYRIKDGKLTNLVRDIVLSCNLFETLANISMVGNDLTFSRAGGCGKAGQSLEASGVGGPHIKIDSVTISGK